MRSCLGLLVLLLAKVNSKPLNEDDIRLNNTQIVKTAEGNN